MATISRSVRIIPTTGAKPRVDSTVFAAPVLLRNAFAAPSVNAGTPAPPPPTGTTALFAPATATYPSFWNKPLPAGGVDPNSDAIIATIVANKSSFHMTNSAAWGYPIFTATTNDPSYTMTSSQYSAGSEGLTLYVPTNVAGSTGSDGHCTVFQPNGSVVDFWGFSRDASGVPHARTVAVARGVAAPGGTSSTIATVRGGTPNAWGTVPPKGSTGNAAVAAGFSMAGGVVFVSDMATALSGNGVIPHALQLSGNQAQIRNAFAWPATKCDGTQAGTQFVCEGTWIRLKSTYDVNASAFPNWKKVLLRTFQTYGGIFSDRGGSWEIRCETQPSATAWTNLGIAIDASVNDLPWDQFEVMTQSTSPAGSSVMPPAPAWWTGG